MLDNLKKLYVKDKRAAIGVVVVALLIFLYVIGIIGQTIAPSKSVGTGGWSEASNTPETSYAIFTSIGYALFNESGRSVLIFIVIAIALISLYIKVGMNKRLTGGIFDEERNLTFSEKGTYGTAKWMSPDELRRVLQVADKPEDANGFILGKEIGTGKILNLDDVSKSGDRVFMNKHIAVFGASGTGKSRAFARPLIIQSVKRGESIIVTDPKGEMYIETSQYMKDNGYDVKILNLVELSHSDAWASLLEINLSGEEQEGQAALFTEILIENTTVNKGGTDYFTNAEKSLFKALTLYILNDNSRNDFQKSIGAVYELLSNTELDKLERIFDSLPSTHPATAPWQIFKKNPNTMGNSMSGLGVRLQILQSQLVKNVMGYNEIDLIQAGKKPTAIYVRMSDQDGANNVIASLFFSFLFIRLVRYADNEGGGRLPVPVNFVLDEFPNIGKIPDFEKKISTVRSREIRIAVIFQNIAQLENRYPNGVWEEIVGNCDTQLFLGATDQTTASYVSRRTGESTIETGSMSYKDNRTIIGSDLEVKGESLGTGKRTLLTPDEVLRLPNDECLIILRGKDVLRANKFDFAEHPESKKFKVSQLKDHIPEWRRVQLEKEMDLTEVLEDESEIEKINKETLLVKPMKKDLIQVEKREVKYDLGQRVSEADFLDDISARTTNDSEIESDFMSSVDFSKSGNYLVTLTTVDKGGILTVMVLVGEPRKQRVIKMNNSRKGTVLRSTKRPTGF